MDLAAAMALGFVLGVAFMAIFAHDDGPPDKPEPKPVLTAAEIVAKKKPKSFRIHKGTDQLRAEFEVKHNQKEQRAERLAQEISDVASRKVDARTQPELRD
jgi:hypothetical protein